MPKYTGTRRTASGVAESRSRPYLTGEPRPHTPRAKRRLVICLRSDGYELALVPRKIYVALPDAKAAKFQMIRVIDESGEDYLFPKSFFEPVRVSQATRELLLSAA